MSRHERLIIARRFLSDLEKKLGPFPYRWLQACAVFPALRFPITLELGAALAAADGVPQPSEQELLKLIALPWFRQGWMPGTVRDLLLTVQSPEDRETTRAALARMSYALVDSALPVDAFGSVTVAQIAKDVPKDWTKRWEGWREGLPDFLPERERAFESLVAPKTTPFWKRPAFVALLCVALAVIGAVSAWFLRDRFAPISQPRPAARGEIVRALLTPDLKFAVLALRDGSIWKSPVGGGTPTLVRNPSGDSILDVFLNRSGEIVGASRTQICNWTRAACTTRGDLAQAAGAADVLWIVGKGGWVETYNVLAAPKMLRNDVSDGDGVTEAGLLVKFDVVPNYPIIVSQDGLRALMRSPGNDRPGTTETLQGLSLVKNSLQMIMFESQVPVQATSRTVIVDTRDSKGPAWLIAYATPSAEVRFVSWNSVGGLRDLPAARFSDPVQFLKFLDDAPLDSSKIVVGMQSGAVATAIDGPQRLIGHTARITDAELSPDRKLLVTASADHTARVWRLKDGASLVLGGHRDAVLLARFEADGKHVVTVGADGNAFRWAVGAFPEPKPLAVTLTAQMIASIMPRARTPDVWAAHFNKVMQHYEINTVNREAMFLASLAHETLELTRLEDILQFSSAQRLAMLWPRQFPSADAARPYLNDPKRLASFLYAGRAGNGDAASGDGWFYRRRGYVMGRSAYLQAQNALGRPYVTAPGLVDEPESMAWTSALFLSREQLNRFADAGDVRGLERAISGGVVPGNNTARYYDIGLKVLAGCLNYRGPQANFRYDDASCKYVPACSNYVGQRDGQIFDFATCTYKAITSPPPPCANYIGERPGFEFDKALCEYKPLPTPEQTRVSSPVRVCSAPAAGRPVCREHVCIEAGLKQLHCGWVDEGLSFTKPDGKTELCRGPEPTARCDTVEAPPQSMLQPTKVPPTRPPVSPQ